MFRGDLPYSILLHCCTSGSTKKKESEDMKTNCNKKDKKEGRKAEGVTGTIVWNGKGFSKNVV